MPLFYYSLQVALTILRRKSLNARACHFAMVTR